jgi:hypothetical protein
MSHVLQKPDTYLSVDREKQAFSCPSRVPGSESVQLSETKVL